MEQLIPIFMCESLEKTREFYQAVGFTVTHWQERPYFYGAVNRGGLDVHFTKGKKSAMCLVHVSDVGIYHRAFADGLRAHYKRIPTMNVPRITRLQPGQTRFHLFDPTGNVLLFVNRDEPEINYDAYDDSLSPLMQALENITFLRDTYADDKSAAKFLDRKLKQYASAEPIDRARALAVRAELTVAMGCTEDSQMIRAELQKIPLSDEERDRFREELQAADMLEQWLIQASDAT